jgi:thiol-disulfide isomerase/thioredoxin
VTPARREALILGATAAAALAGGGLVAALRLQSASGAARLLGAQFADLTGRERQLIEWRGRLGLINFWATWCEPCREEVHILDAAEQQYRSQGFSAIGIGIDSAANVRQFASNYKLSYQMLIAGPETIDLMRALGNSSGGLPFSVLLSRSGEVVHRKLGAFSAAELQQVVASLLR